MEAIVYTTKGGSTMDAIKNIIIRLETKEDYRAVENLTRESFWNVYRPGCMEHYVLTVIGMTRHLCRSWIL